jgi:site-specific recombinase XerD
MATFSLNLLHSKSRKDGQKQIVVHLSSGGTKDIIRTGIFVQESQWDTKNKFVIGGNARVYNRRLDIIKGNIQTVINTLTIQGTIKSTTAKDLKGLIESDTTEIPSVQHFIPVNVLNTPTLPAGGKNAYFFDFSKDVISRINKKRTQDTYSGTCKKIREFLEAVNQGISPEGLTFNHIDVGFIKRFDSWMEKDGLMVNSRSVNLRNLRKLYNDAIDENLASLEQYPFRRFKIKTEKTKKRNMLIEDLVKLRDFGSEPHQQQYIDMFFLGFYLIGINLIDLCHLTKIEKNGRVEYRRAKTGRLYSIKVEPEARAIIDKYRGKEYLIDVMERNKDHATYLGRLNNNLKALGEVEIVSKYGKKKRDEKDRLFPDLSWYYARHTWATIASNLKISKDIIAKALGHGAETTTDVYINFNQEDVDIANRQVIDFVNNWKAQEKTN